MQKLPVISGAELIKYLTKKGFQPTHQRGSHVVLRSPGNARISVPLHDELDRGTLMGILERAGISKEEFLKDWAD
jgi:predicted RNA binding protein YcfA (HicA-like mRNA interferase family)